MLELFFSIMLYNILYIHDQSKPIIFNIIIQLEKKSILTDKKKQTKTWTRHYNNLI